MVQERLPDAQSHELLFQQMVPPPKEFNPGPEYEMEKKVTQYIWKKGSYRCGITAHIIFFLLSPGFVQRAAQAKPLRFGNLIKFALSFDFTDVFIKRVTASGRGKASGNGLEDADIRKMLVSIQKAHDVIGIPHIEMVHFGYRLLQQLESDIGGLSPKAKEYHLRYMCHVYHTMGLPFSTDRQLLENFCAEIEAQFSEFTAISAPYTQRLLFLGLTVGVPCNKEILRELLPKNINVIFDCHYDEMRPSMPWIVTGKLLNFLLYPRRRFRNPQPSASEKAFIATLN